MQSTTDASGNPQTRNTPLAQLFHAHENRRRRVDFSEEKLEDQRKLSKYVARQELYILMERMGAPVTVQAKQASLPILLKHVNWLLGYRNLPYRYEIRRVPGNPYHLVRVFPQPNLESTDRFRTWRDNRYRTIRPFFRRNAKKFARAIRSLAGLQMVHNVPRYLMYRERGYRK